MSKIRLIGKNISFVVFSRFVSLLVSFIIFPYIVRQVGKEVYGVYLFVTTITGYFGLLDLGVMSALIKYVSEFHGKGDHKKVDNIISASFSFYAIVGIFIGLLLFICSIYFINFFKIDSANARIIRQLFLAAAIFSVISWPLNTFSGITQGLNLWKIYAAVNIFIQVFYGLVTFIMLSHGCDIVHLFIAMQIVTVIGSMVYYYLIKKRAYFTITFPYRETHTYKFLFNFSFYVFFASLLNIFIFGMHNLIIGYFISMSAVAVYSVAYNIQNYFRVINATISGPPWILASEMEGRRDYEGQRKLILNGTKYMSAIFLPVVLIMLFFAKPFINYWMGPGFQESILPARIIIIFWLFAGTSELASGMLTAKGIVKEPLLIQLAMAVINILIGVSLIKSLGITAIALGLTVSLAAIGFPLILKLSLNKVKVTYREYFNKGIKRNLGLYLFVSILSFLAFRFIYPANILLTFLEMATIYLISIPLYYLIILSRKEKDEIRVLLGMNKFSLGRIFAKA